MFKKYFSVTKGKFSEIKKNKINLVDTSEGYYIENIYL